MAKRVTIIGGGSSMFVPHLLRLFMRSTPLRGSTICLMDVDGPRVEAMAGMARRLVANEGLDLTIEHTTEQRPSLVGSDYVIVAISVGGMAAWEQDIEIPGRYGIFTEVHDSIGPGGIMRAFRHVPVLADICRDLAEVSPDDLAMPPLVGGINHCAGIIDLRFKDGTSLMPRLRTRTLADITAGLQQAYQAADPAMVQQMMTTLGVRPERMFEMFVRSTGFADEVTPWALQRFGILPYCWTHWIEFFPQLLRLNEPYKGRAQGLAMKYGTKVFDMNDKRARVKRWQDLTERWSRPEHADEVRLEALPAGEEDQGVEVVDIIEAMLENRNAVHIVNTTNNGSIDNLPADGIVEVNAAVSSYGIRPLHTGPLPEALAAHLRLHLSVQRLTMEAALSGDRNTAFQALQLDPATAAVLEPGQIGRLLDELLAANARYLPRFA